jgi:alkylated DNA repair dioxygenase AlkB
MIPGLQLIRNFLNAELQHELITQIDAQPWSTVLKRRVQHYGAVYDYSKRSVVQSSKQVLMPLPDWSKQVVNRVIQAGMTTTPFDQIIVNEYLPGQGIAPHVDSSKFGPEIVTISLGSTCIMTFSNMDRNKCVDIWLEPGDLMRLTGDARQRWCHQIRPRKRDSYQGRNVIRQRRISLTFRTVVRSPIS